MIFNLFKSKPSLKELIPQGFVDIHSHILPGIDDGAKNVEESLELISEMKNLGFSKIIATPHTYPGIYNNDNNSIKKAFEQLKSPSIKNIELDFASEYMLDNSIIDKAINKNLLCIKDNYVLVEMSFISYNKNVHEILFKLQINGYIPILAHPERYLYLNMDDMYNLKKIGCLFQINMLSLSGYYGKNILLKVNQLLSKKLISFIGSDTHNLNHLNFLKKKLQIKHGNIKEVEKVFINTIKQFN